jgi:hypothetical protein
MHLSKFSHNESYNRGMSLGRSTSIAEGFRREFVTKPKEDKSTKKTKGKRKASMIVVEVKEEKEDKVTEIPLSIKDDNTNGHNDNAESIQVTIKKDDVQESNKEMESNS